MKKIKEKLPLIAVIAAVAIVIGIFYIPVSMGKLIESSTDETSTIHILLNGDAQKEFTTGDGVKGDALTEKVLSYLSTCKVRRTLDRQPLFSDIQYIISGTVNGLLHIDLTPDGDNLIISGNQLFYYKFIDGEDVVSNVREIIKEYGEPYTMPRGN